MYWRVEVSFVTGRTTALGLKEVVAIEGEIMVKSREQKIRLKNVEAING